MELLLFVSLLVSFKFEYELSAAFDVIDHKSLQTHLEHSFGVTGMTTSEGKCLNFGVPEGSVLGPRKYCLYSKPINAIYSRHHFLYHCYEEDTQVYIAIMPKTTWSDVAKKLEACLADISTWMSANMLKLNEEKTALIIFNPKTSG